MPRKPANPEVWTLTLRAEGDGPPVEIRVRRVLKWLLRSFGLRCVRVSEERQPEAEEGKQGAD